jgi:hypothetical protein
MGRSETLYFGGRKGITLLEDFQALPVRHSDKGRMRAKTLR